jgi:membrane peptidoglycan carboxypeptidase
MSASPQRPYRRPSSKRPAWINAPLQAWQWIHDVQQRLGWKKFLLRCTGITVLLLFLYFIFLILTLPSVEQTINHAAQSTVITDRNGIELYRVHGEQDRTNVKGDDIAKSMKQAMVAIEDARFYERGCIDMRALARAVFLLGRRGGASTLTRQLARNALNLQHENVVNRKLKELILGCQMEWQFSKEEILDLYLNWVPFGNNTYGIEQASQRYFGKNAKDLTLAESSVLAGLPQLPSYYSPYGRHVRTAVSEAAKEKIVKGKVTKSSQLDDDEVTIGLLGITVGSGSTSLYVGGRTDQVLKNMQDQGMIKEEDRQQALKELQKITFQPSREALRSPHFVLWTKDQVERTFEGTDEKGLLEQGGLTIQTTLDWNLQKIAEATVAKFRDTVAKTYKANNIALIAMDPKTKEILAYVGNADYGDDEHEGKVDMALVPRAPGSSFKPFIYAGAFLKGYSPATVIHDVHTKFGSYEPQNYEGGFWGLTNARSALAGSRNIPAIKAYFLGGEETTLLPLVESMGVPTPRKLKPQEGYGPSMAIGTAETPLLEMVQGYATLADGGKFKPAISFQKITDARGTILPLPTLLDPSYEGEEVLDPRIAYQITSILSDVAARPGEYWQNILSVSGTQAAAKTGTSNKCLERDSKQNCTKRLPDNVWTIGYSPTLVVGVWVGNATSTPMSEKADGITVAAPIWKDFMTQATKQMKPEVTTFSMPEGMVQAQVSLLSGELPTECTPLEMRRSDVFLQEDMPTEADPACVTVEVDKVTGLLASNSCPADARETKSFYVPTSLLGTRFPEWQQSVLEWAKTAEKLPLPLVPTEQCDVSKTPGRLQKPTVTLLSPSSGGRAAYPSFTPKFEYTVGSSVRQVDFTIDGKPAGSFEAAPFKGAIRVPRSITTGGSHVLQITLTDEFYNTVSDQVSFSFEGDTGGPSVSLTSPTTGTTITIRSPLTIRASASDTEGGVKYVEFFLDGTLLTRKPSEPYEFTYSIDKTGEHTIRAVATDLAGNTSADEVSVTVQ